MAARERDPEEQEHEYELDTRVMVSHPLGKPDASQLVVTMALVCKTCGDRIVWGFPGPHIQEVSEALARVAGQYPELTRPHPTASHARGSREVN